MNSSVLARLEPVTEVTVTATESSQASLYVTVLVAILCSVVILLALIGNTLVVSVIIRYKQLQNATNYILLSLAIADITVAFLVMIPATIQDVTGEWIFSQLFCKFYNAFDITCCTASILNLLLVAIDRYIAIFRPLKYRDFVRNRFSDMFFNTFFPLFFNLNICLLNTLYYHKSRMISVFLIHKSICHQCLFDLLNHVFYHNVVIVSLVFSNTSKPIHVSPRQKTF